MSNDYIKRDEYTDDMNVLRKLAEDVSFVRGKMEANADSTKQVWTAIGILGSIMIGIYNILK